MLSSTHYIVAPTELNARLWGQLALALALALTLSAASGWLLSRPPSAQAQQAEACDVPGTLHILPAATSVQVGQVVTVEIWLEDVGNYYGLDFRLAFDPALLQVPAGRVTPLWDVFHPSYNFTIKNEAHNISGTVWYAITNMNPAQPFTGTGRACAIAFAGVASGTVPLQFTYAKGSTRSGAGMFPTMVDGQIAVRTPERHPAYLPLVVRGTAVP